MIYLKLFITFLKIGLFSFGGGYGMIPLIRKEIIHFSWLTPSEFIDIIAIAEMTPGPISINSATFVGYKVAGFLGSVSATIGVTLPSFVIAILVSQFFIKHSKHPLYIYMFYGMRPVITSLVMAAAVFVAGTSIFTQEISIESIRLLICSPLKMIDITSVMISLLALIGLVKLKFHPILIIILSGVLGIILFL